MTIEWLHSPDLRSFVRSSEEELEPWMFWTYAGVSIALVAMAGLMSGLTLGLMSLDELDLEVLKRSGTETERRHAKRIMPVIANEHHLLVTLLLFNALSTEALPIFLDRLVDPVTAVILSVTVVLVFGEILPQAVCRSYGLQVGSYSAWLVALLKAVSAPVSWPIGQLLDAVLGGEHTALFRRAQLKALVGLHSSAEGLGGTLTADEISIISGALDLTSKTAWTAMTPLDKVFLLPADQQLDEATLREILVSGHSRVPVHLPGDRSSLLGLILVKELVLVDPEAALTAGQLVSRQLPRLPADTPLYQLLRLFEAGGSHMVALTQPPLPAPAAGDPAQPPPAAAPGQHQQQGLSASRSGSLTRIRSGVIKSGDNMLYIEAEQVFGDMSPPLAGSPAAAAWGLAGEAGRQGSGGAWGAAAAAAAAAGVREGEPVGIITIEDVIEELLQQEIIDETDQYVDNLQATRVDAYALTTTLPPRLRKAYAQQFTPRVGRLVVHHHHPHRQSGAGQWRDAAATQHHHLQDGLRTAYSNPATPLSSSPLLHPSPPLAAAMAAAAAAAAGSALGSSADSSSHRAPSRLSDEVHPNTHWGSHTSSSGHFPPWQQQQQQQQQQAQASASSSVSSPLQQQLRRFHSADPAAAAAAAAGAGSSVSLPGPPGHSGSFGSSGSGSSNPVPIRRLPSSDAAAAAARVVGFHPSPAGGGGAAAAAPAGTAAAAASPYRRVKFATVPEASEPGSGIGSSGGGGGGSGGGGNVISGGFGSYVSGVSSDAGTSQGDAGSDADDADDADDYTPAQTALGQRAAAQDGQARGQQGPESGTRAAVAGGGSMGDLQQPLLLQQGGSSSESDD